MPLWAKKELQQNKGSLVRLALRHTRRHRVGHLSLHFGATSTMIAHAPSTIMPQTVLRSDYETLGRLASSESKPLDLNVCPTPSSSSRRFYGATDKP
jgi:hypothetical protein